MKKSKKLLALLTALSISATAFAGLATTAFADGAGTEEDPYYKIDFEGDSEGQKVKGYDGDTSPNITNIQSDDGLVTYFVGSGNRQAGNISVANDATMGHYASINAMRFADAESTNKRAPSIKINSPRALDQVSAGKAYVFKFDYKINAKKSAIFINNDDDQPSGDFIKLLMTDIPTDKWLTAYAEFDTEKKMCSVETYDGETLINEQANFYTATGSPSRLRFTSYDNATYNYCIDNITVFERTPTVKYQVTYKTWGDVESKEVVKADQKPAAVPDPETKGKIFKGWKKDGAEEPLYTTEQVKDMAITSDTVFEGVYEDDPEYRQSIANVEFVAKEENVIGNPESPDADDVYTYTVKVTSDIGNDITDACDIEWSIVGEETDDNYVTLAQKQDEPKTATLTIKNGVSNYFGYITAKAVYTPKPYEVAEPGEGITFQRKLVDGEAKNIVTVKNSEANANLAAATLIYAEYTNKGALETLKTYPLTFTNGVATQEMPDAKNDAKLMVWKKISGEGEGVIEPLCPAAKVSGADTEFVGPTTETVQVPYAIIGKPDSTGNIYPTAGYPTDYSLYADSIVGYKATSDGLNTKDLVLGEWSIYGSLATRDLELVKDETTGKKSLKFSTTGGNRGGTGSSALGVYQWASQEEQYTIEMTLKGNASVAVANTTVNNTHIEECGYSISGGNLTAGGETISGIDAGAFYKILMSCDPTACSRLPRK